jgi:hypothetical protein
MVVAVGVTVAVPPLSGRVTVVESTLFVITTWEALLAVTVSTLDCDEVIELRLAEMVTAGPAGGVTVTVPGEPLGPPQPINQPATQKNRIDRKTLSALQEETMLI